MTSRRLSKAFGNLGEQRLARRRPAKSRNVEQRPMKIILPTPQPSKPSVNGCGKS